MEAINKFWQQQWLPLPGGGGITAGQIVEVAAVLIGGYLLSRFLGYLLGRKLATTTLRPDAIYVFKRVLFLALIVIVILTALAVLGIPLTAFAFATGAIAIGVGFGAQNIINNFISGWILIAERPIRINDFLEIDGKNGTVEHIGTRSTRIRRSDGVHMLVPNSQLLERTVINWTLMDRAFRTVVRVGVAYGSPVRKVEELILQALSRQAGVKPEPPPIVVFEDFGDNALIFEAYFWADVNSGMELRVIRSGVRFALEELFGEAGIVIAFPQRDVHLDTGGALEVVVREGHRK